MLRAALLAIAICLTAAAIGAALYDPGNWPLVIWPAVMAIALAIERRHYGAAQTQAPGAGWVKTSERFFDDAAGHRVDVWFNAATGERRYVRAD